MELRIATRSDIPALSELIELSGRALSIGYYSPEQADAITRHVFGVDTQLVDDRTYFVIEHNDHIVACGGWSKRRTLFGGDQTKTGSDPLLDPTTEPARIRVLRASVYGTPRLGSPTHGCMHSGIKNGWLRLIGAGSHYARRTTLSSIWICRLGAFCIGSARRHSSTGLSHGNGNLGRRLWRVRPHENSLATHVCRLALRLTSGGPV